MNQNRYIRQTLLSQIGNLGQEKLGKAKIAIVGCGGLGSIAAPYLAGAGVGTLLLIDHDTIDITNLHRQVFYSESDKDYKSNSLANHINALNSDVDTLVYTEMLTKKNIDFLLNDVDIVLECTDNIQTKYLVNDYCHINKIPMVYGAIYKYDGYISLFANQSNVDIHLRDIFADPNDNIPSCAEVGVINTVAGLIGMLQANEAIKYLTNAGVTLQGHLISYNILSNDQMKLKLKKNYLKDMVVLYSESDYHANNNCAVSELSISMLMSDRSNYQLISILEYDEHISIDDEVVHIPLSTIDIEVYEPPQKPTVFYCMSGRRSSVLVKQLLERNSSLNIFTLSGGLMMFHS